MLISASALAANRQCEQQNPTNAAVTMVDGDEAWRAEQRALGLLSSSSDDDREEAGEGEARRPMPRPRVLAPAKRPPPMPTPEKAMSAEPRAEVQLKLEPAAEPTSGVGELAEAMASSPAVCAAAWAAILQALRLPVPAAHPLHHGRWREALVAQGHGGADGAAQWAVCIDRLRRGLVMAGVGRHTLQQRAGSTGSPSPRPKARGQLGGGGGGGGGFLGELLAVFADPSAMPAGPAAVSPFAGFAVVSQFVASSVDLSLPAALLAAAAAAAGSGPAAAGAVCSCVDCLAAERLDLQLLEAIEVAGIQDWGAVAAAAGSGRTPDACRLWWSAVTAELKAEESAVGGFGALRVRDSSLLLRLQNQYLRDHAAAEASQRAEAQALLRAEDSVTLLGALRAALSTLQAERRSAERSLEAELGRERAGLLAVHGEQVAALRAYAGRMKGAGPGCAAGGSPRERVVLAEESEIHSNLLEALVDRERAVLAGHAEETDALAGQHAAKRAEWLGSIDAVGKVARAGPLGELDARVAKLTADIAGLKDTAAALEARWLKPSA